MHDQTVTLFNYHQPTNAWYPALFTGVTLNEVRGSTASVNAGTQNADTVEALIPVSAEQSATDSKGTVIQYVGPKAYAALENPAGYFTFAPEQDFFAVGDYTADADSPIPDTDYDGGFYHAMNTGRDSVYAVTSAAFFPLIPHFEIGGR